MLTNIITLPNKFICHLIGWNIFIIKMVLFDWIYLGIVHKLWIGKWIGKRIGLKLYHKNLVHLESWFLVLWKHLMMTFSIHPIKGSMMNFSANQIANFTDSLQTIPHRSGSKKNNLKQIAFLFYKNASICLTTKKIVFQKKSENADQLDKRRLNFTKIMQRICLFSFKITN